MDASEAHPCGEQITAQNAFIASCRFEDDQRLTLEAARPSLNGGGGIVDPFDCLFAEAGDVEPRLRYVHPNESLALHDALRHSWLWSARRIASGRKPPTPVRVLCDRNAGGVEMPAVVNDPSTHRRPPAFSLARENAIMQSTPSVQIDVWAVGRQVKQRRPGGRSLCARHPLWLPRLSITTTFPARVREQETDREDEERLTADVVERARQYRRYGYRKIAELLRTRTGWIVNDKRVESGGARG